MGFYTSTHQAITQTSCINEPLFIEGLQEGEKLVSLEPFILFSNNGLAVGLDNHFTQFQHINSQGEILAYLHLNWHNCETIESSVNNNEATNPTVNSGLINISLFICILIILGVLYVKNS